MISGSKDLKGFENKGLYGFEEFRNDMGSKEARNSRASVAILAQVSSPLVAFVFNRWPS